MLNIPANTFFAALSFLFFLPSLLPIHLFQTAMRTKEEEEEGEGTMISSSFSGLRRNL